MKTLYISEHLIHGSRILRRSEKITAHRYNELEQMKQFVDTNDCYMEFISKQLR
jgi:hypothetical protein